MAIRLLLAIPHFFVLAVWGLVVEVVTIAQWFICVITGKRNEGIFNMANGYAAYSARVSSYMSLLHDTFPPFGTSEGAVPVQYRLAFEPSANRLTVLLRLFWMIPAAVINYVLGIVAQILMFIAWFAILFTGKMPRGMFDFILKWFRHSIQLQAYGLLLTDTYPALAN